MTPEQVEKYLSTRRCPFCDSNEIVTEARDEDWEPYELPESSALMVSKSCGVCTARWTEEYRYALVDVSLDEEE